jgi:uncharacterized repeat protein (TIGR01451 family)
LAGGFNATGSIIFNVYGPNDATCSAAVAFTATVPVAGDGLYASGSFTPTLAGTYRWVASYTGDANNAAVTSPCNAPNESVGVGVVSPTLVTQASASVPIGGSISDGGTLAGGSSPTGSIAFNVYGPNDAACSGASVFTANIPVAGNGLYASGSFTPALAGTYRWTATYSGDANNAAVASPCNAPNENVVVTQATPTLTTQASAPVSLGGSVSDAGTLAGGASPTGLITFNLYGPNDATCSASTAFTASIPVAGNGLYSSGSFTPAAAGTYRWVASYSGDANNAAVTSPCNAPNESVVVSAGAAVAGTKTVTPGPYAVGGTITYTVTLTNSGSAAQADNAGNEFIDVLPPTLALVSATATSSVAVATVATNTVTWNGGLLPGNSVTITITATILPAAASSTVSNQGTINFDGDGNGSNESSALTDDPAVAGSANPTSIAVPAAANGIPALSPFALLLLIALIAAISLLKLTRMS